MRQGIRILAIVVLMSDGGASGQGGPIIRDMSPERIREAIALGMKEKQLGAYKIQEKARFSWPPVIALYTTPFMRVAVAAHEANKRYKTFTEADVTPDMLEPEIHVYASSQPSRGATIANVETIAILPRDSKDRSRAIQPIRSVEASQAYKNLFGFSAEGRGLLAVFPLDVWNESNEIHVVFDNEIAGSHGWGAAGDCTDCKSRIYLDKIR